MDMPLGYGPRIVRVRILPGAPKEKNMVMLWFSPAVPTVLPMMTIPPLFLAIALFFCIGTFLFTVATAIIESL